MPAGRDHPAQHHQLPNFNRYEIGSHLPCRAGSAGFLNCGFRRAHGPDGGLAASRAAYIGGCAQATSNVLAGKVFGIPVKGTHAHSWVMTLNLELDAFAAFANAMPCKFGLSGRHLRHSPRDPECDRSRQRTSKTWSPVRRHQAGFRRPRPLPYYRSRLLDEAGFPDAKIIASNDLDEYIISSLRQQGARIDIWGVGTKLVTAFVSRH